MAGQHCEQAKGLREGIAHFSATYTYMYTAAGSKIPFAQELTSKGIVQRLPWTGMMRRHCALVGDKAVSVFRELNPAEHADLRRAYGAIASAFAAWEFYRASVPNGPGLLSCSGAE